jgi:hypothetical protein
MIIADIGAPRAAFTARISPHKKAAFPVVPPHRLCKASRLAPRFEQLAKPLVAFGVDARRLKVSAPRMIQTIF